MLIDRCVLHTMKTALYCCVTEITIFHDSRWVVLQSLIYTRTEAAKSEKEADSSLVGAILVH